LLRVKLREILRGTSAEDLEEPLEKLLGELIERFEPLAVIIAGSLAERRFVSGLSDVDILVVVDRPVGDAERFSLVSLGKTDAEVTVVAQEELERAVRAGNQFYLKAVRSGKVIYMRRIDAKEPDRTPTSNSS